MAAGIVQPDGTKCYSGATCRKHGAHNAAQQAKNSTVAGSVKQQLTVAKKKAIGQALPPVIVEKSVLQNPYYTDVTSVVDTDFDSYGCDGCYGCETGNDYCRGGVYENLRVTSVSSQAVLTKIFQTNELPEDLLKLGEELELDDPESYDAFGEAGYYGQQQCVELREDKAAELTKWYYARDNASDHEGILDYVRAKGVPTKDLSPLEAIKQQLKTENSKSLPSVEAATDVSLQTLMLSRIAVPSHSHYEEVEGRTPKALADSKPVTGVVLQKNGKLILIDGYHRLKNAKDGNRWQGNFIVLR